MSGPRTSIPTDIAWGGYLSNCVSFFVLAVLTTKDEAELGAGIFLYIPLTAAFFSIPYWFLAYWTKRKFIHGKDFTSEKWKAANCFTAMLATQTVPILFEIVAAGVVRLGPSQFWGIWFSLTLGFPFFALHSAYSGGVRRNKDF